jgi:hypothetical protein
MSHGNIYKIVNAVAADQQGQYQQQYKVERWDRKTEKVKKKKLNDHSSA